MGTSDDQLLLLIDRTADFGKRLRQTCRKIRPENVSYFGGENASKAQRRKVEPNERVWAVDHQDDRQ